MTDQFMQDATIREMYGITGDAAFETTFSKVSIESILFYVFAATAYVLEAMFDQFRKDVNERIAANIVPTIRWYHSQALAFQYGDRLVYDDATRQYCYRTVDESKQLVKYVAVRDRGGSIQVLVSADENGRPTPLSDEVLMAFKAYMDSVKIAGVILAIQSLPADSIRINAKVQVDPMLINKSGVRLSDGSTPVADAVNAYLSGIVYGGTFNKTKLIDAIQAVEGVIDVTLGACSAKAFYEVDYANITTNNYTAKAGSFISDNLLNSLEYVV